MRETKAKDAVWTKNDVMFLHRQIDELNDALLVQRAMFDAMQPLYEAAVEVVKAWGWSPTIDKLREALNELQSSTTLYKAIIKSGKEAQHE